MNEYLDNIIVQQAIHVAVNMACSMLEECTTITYAEVRAH